MTEQQFNQAQHDGKVEKPEIPDGDKPAPKYTVDELKRILETYLPFLEQLRRGALNAVGASLYSASSQSVPSSSTKVNLNTVTFNEGMTVDTGSHRVTVMTPGYYLIQAQITYNTTADTKIYQTIIRKNGFSDLANPNIQSASSNQVSVFAGTVALLEVADYIELFSAHGNALNENLNSGAHYTYLNIIKL